MKKRTFKDFSNIGHIFSEQERKYGIPFEALKFRRGINSYILYRYERGVRVEINLHTDDAIIARKWLECLNEKLKAINPKEDLPSYKIIEQHYDDCYLLLDSQLSAMQHEMDRLTKRISDWQDIVFRLTRALNSTFRLKEGLKKEVGLDQETCWSLSYFLTQTQFKNIFKEN